MYGTDLHTFGDLTRIRHNHHICQNCKNHQIVDDIVILQILLLCAFLDISAPQDQILPRDSVLESTVGNSPSSVLPAHVQQEVPTATEQTNVTVGSEQPTCRRSGRIRHPVDRLNL